MERESRSIRLLDGLLFLMLGALLVGTVVFVPVVLFSGGGSTTVAAEIPAPRYSVRLADGGRVVVRDGAVTSTDQPAHPTDEAFVIYRDHLGVEVNVPSMGAAKGAVAAMLLGTFGLLWLGLVNLRRIVRSAREEGPFIAANVGRLRWLATAVLLWPVVGTVSNRLLEAAFDDQLSIRLLPRDPSTWTCILIGVGLLALAEVFREGVALRELEQGTV